VRLAVLNFKIKERISLSNILERKSILQINECTINLPCYFPSISSIKTNLSTLDYLEVLNAVDHSCFLISAYDVNNANVGEREEIINIINIAKSKGKTVLMDSGNYESYWNKDRGWNKDLFHSIILSLNVNIAFSYDNQNPGSDLKIIVDDIEETFRSNQEITSNTVISPIVHAPLELLPQVVTEVAKRLKPAIIAIPERELGEGIINRAKTLMKIRKSLNETGEYVPIHLLGTGNPISLIIFSLAGADSFDGLEWCQTTVDHSSGQLHHFQLRELFDEQPISALTLPYAQITLANNLIFYRKFMKEIQNAIYTNNASLLIRTYIPNNYYQVLKNALPEVFE
jgi:queuine/archaeosine tRNA-ribosyltransferase